MDKPLREISRLDAEKFRQYLKGDGLAQATISKRIKTARQAFERGVEWEMLDKNPFKGVKAGKQSNDARQFFITREDTRKVLDACPGAQWRLIVALSRYGGLRCPSETLALRWSDVDWEHDRLRITSPKTEGYEGKDSRVLPLFPELKPYLLSAFEEAEEGAQWVVTKGRDAAINLRTQFERIIGRAGLTPWPKLFHNLRSTRQTELEEQFPSHVVCRWLGNSERIAREHYLQVTDAHFEKAVKSYVHNTEQQGAEMTRNESKPAPAQVRKTPELPGFATDCDSVQESDMTPTGFEPVSRP